MNFVNWFRSASPYIHAHRGRTFVISFGGEVLKQNPSLIHDVALLNSLGIRLILVPGIRPQIDEELDARKQQPRYVNGVRVTDEIALQCVKAASGEVSSEIEGLLSMGLTNSPITNSKITTIRGNFIIAQPYGVRDGVDYYYTGEVRRVDAAAISHQLDQGSIVLISPIGYSLTGEVFNLLTEEVAMRVAISLKADKWIYLTSEQQINRELSLDEARQYSEFFYAIKACENNVQRVHILDQQIEGVLLQELFTRDGIGTLISVNPFDDMRQATIEDVGGILALIKPLEEEGNLVRRSREKLEMEIEHFIVEKREGMIIACAAMYPFVEDKMAELACLVVHNNYRGSNHGDTLLSFLEHKARQLGINHLFVLTTRTAHWFRERGFVAADLESLPVSRRNLYNYQRNSQVFIKKL
jgi:amino-acid N-acetyltransferase